MYISIMSSSLRSDSVSPSYSSRPWSRDVDVLGNLKHSSHVLFDDEHVSPAILQDLHLLEDIVDEGQVQTPALGSSNNRISGSGINARPNATIIC